MRSHFPLLASIALLCLVAPALAQEPSPTDFLTMTLQQDELLTAGAVGPILDHPGVTDADKDLVRNSLKPMDYALAAMKENARTNPTIESITADQQKVAEASAGVMSILQSRTDLYWIQLHDKGLLQIEAGLMQEKPADFVDMVKAAGGDAAKAKAIVDQFKADFEDLRKKVAQGAGQPNMAAQMALSTALSQKMLGVTKAINALFTPDQRFDFEWAVGKAIRDDGEDETPFFILGFASQPAMAKAPETGTYLLKSAAGDPKAPPTVIASVALAKGNPIGFKKTDKSTTAAAGDKSFDVPAGSINDYFWQFSPAKKP